MSAKQGRVNPASGESMKGGANLVLISNPSFPICFTRHTVTFVDNQGGGGGCPRQAGIVGVGKSPGGRGEARHPTGQVVTVGLNPCRRAGLLQIPTSED